MNTAIGQQAFVLLAAILWFFGCEETSAQRDANQQNSSARGSSGKRRDVSSDGDAVGGDQVASNADQAFVIFCERAVETDTVRKQLARHLKKFCNEGRPTKTLTSSLVNSAYSGSDEPVLKKIEEWELDKQSRTTAGFFAVGIKLPISIEEHFNKVGPNGGDESVIKQVIESSAGTTADIVRVKEKHSKQGKYQVRGWTVEQKTTRTLKPINIKTTTHTVSRSDQYELEKGIVYLYTSYVTDAIETIKVFDTLTAGVKVGDDSYLLTVSYVQIDNKGVDSVARDAIKSSAVDVVKQMYDAADKAR